MRFVLCGLINGSNDVLRFLRSSDPIVLGPCMLPLVSCPLVMQIINE